jgi:hypothetical protein
VTVDLYAATPAVRRVVFNKSGLVAGSHTLKVTVLGTRNASSTDTRVDVDAFAYVQ